MREKKELDFKPIRLQKLKLDIDKLLAKKEREKRKIFKKFRDIFKY
jgi:hypothetical protein